MQNITLALIQTSLHWENKAANLAMFEEKMQSITPSADVIFLPEMFTTGFSMQSHLLAEDMQGATVQWMRQQAQRLDAVVCGSFIAKNQGQYYNRLVWMQPDGHYHTYDKRHLFRMGDEQQHYSAGTKRLITEWKGWRFCPMICYDLRFPVWARNRNDYDVLLFVANWPHRRSAHWKLLLQARAVENLSYAVGVNRVGDDGNNIYHSGDSSVFSPRGELMWQQTDDEAIEVVELKAHDLLEYRQVFPAHLDADEFDIR
jgi:predicted amidohydrolase